MSSPSRPLAPEVSPPHLSSESANYRRASLALFLAGFSTFSLLYCVQPLLPAFSRGFHLNPATSALALSTSTGALALSIFIMGCLIALIVATLCSPAC
jgi:MFS transporter, YNFM family, putative membrane transport protein